MNGRLCSRCKTAVSRADHAYCRLCTNAYQKARHRRIAATPRIREIEEHGHKKSHPLYRAVQSARERAKQAGVAFDLDIWQLSVPSVCPVLGIPLDSSDLHHTPSIDRFVPSKGYTHQNVRIMSFRANSIKTDATADELLKVWQYVANG